MDEGRFSTLVFCSFRRSRLIFLNEIQILVSQKKKFDKLQNAKTVAQCNCLLCFMGRIKVRLIEKMEK